MPGFCSSRCHVCAAMRSGDADSAESARAGQRPADCGAQQHLCHRRLHVAAAAERMARA